MKPKQWEKRNLSEPEVEGILGHAYTNKKYYLAVQQHLKRLNSGDKV